MKMGRLFLTTVLVLSALVVVRSKEAPPPPDGEEEGQQAFEKGTQEGREHAEHTIEEPKKQEAKGPKRLVAALQARHKRCADAFADDKWSNLERLFTSKVRMLTFNVNATEGAKGVVEFFKEVKEFVSISNLKDDKAHAHTDSGKTEEQLKSIKKELLAKVANLKVKPVVKLVYDIHYVGQAGRDAAWAKGVYAIESTHNNADYNDKGNSTNTKADKDDTDVVDTDTKMYNVDAGDFNEWYVRRGGRWYSSELVHHSSYGALEPPPSPHEEYAKHDTDDNTDWSEGDGVDDQTYPGHPDYQPSDDKENAEDDIHSGDGEHHTPPGAEDHGKDQGEKDAAKADEPGEADEHSDGHHSAINDDEQPPPPQDEDELPEEVNTDM